MCRGGYPPRPRPRGRTVQFLPYGKRKKKKEIRMKSLILAQDER